MQGQPFCYPRDPRLFLDPFTTADTTKSGAAPCAPLTPHQMAARSLMEGRTCDEAFPGASATIGEEVSHMTAPRITTEQKPPCELYPFPADHRILNSLPLGSAVFPPAAASQALRRSRTFGVDPS